MNSAHRCASVRVLILLIFCGASVSQAQTAFFDFNPAGQLTGSFNQWNDNGSRGDRGSCSFAESSSGGVANSGAVSIIQNQDTAATYGGSWNSTLALGVLSHYAAMMPLLSRLRASQLTVFIPK